MFETYFEGHSLITLHTGAQNKAQNFQSLSIIYERSFLRGESLFHWSHESQLSKENSAPLLNLAHRTRKRPLPGAGDEYWDYLIRFSSLVAVGCFGSSSLGRPFLPIIGTEASNWRWRECQLGGSLQSKCVRILAIISNVFIQIIMTRGGGGRKGEGCFHFVNSELLNQNSTLLCRNLAKPSSWEIFWHLTRIRVSLTDVYLSSVFYIR